MKKNIKIAFIFMVLQLCVITENIQTNKNKSNNENLN